MAFVDDITLHAEAGRGGNGVVRFLHEKFKEFGGPCGGNGGHGGDVYVEGIRDIGILFSYKTIKGFKAENAGHGETRSRKGKDGEDVTIKIPIGSVVTNVATGQKLEILKEGERVRILRGGRGGLGNEHFKSSTNQTPQEFTPGELAEEGDFHIEVQLIAEAGFVGLPNAGKSSLLNAITRAKAKVANYAFTTLEPNLGDYYGHILADIPGLIEGASSGKGLGNKFLRHISRTGLIIHCVSLEQEDPFSVYTMVRKEIEAYPGNLAEKEEIIVLTKADLVETRIIDDAKKAFKKHKKSVIVTSIEDHESLSTFGKELLKALKK